MILIVSHNKLSIYSLWTYLIPRISPLHRVKQDSDKFNIRNQCCYSHWGHVVVKIIGCFLKEHYICLVGSVICKWTHVPNKQTKKKSYKSKIKNHIVIFSHCNHLDWISVIKHSHYLYFFFNCISAIFFLTPESLFIASCTDLWQLILLWNVLLIRLQKLNNKSHLSTEL